MKLSVLFSLVASVTLAASTTAAIRQISHRALQQQQQQQTIPLIPAHVQRRRRGVTEQAANHSVRRRDNAVQVGALYQGYGTHYIDLWVGTPPQRQTLIVDTGSGVTAFPCSGCTDCGQGHHIDDNFSEATSSTFEKIPCGQCTRGHCAANGNPADDCSIGMSYQEGSNWSAFESRDSAYVGGPHDHPLLKDDGADSDLDPLHASAFSFPMLFGCQTKLTGLFKTQLADGIMGMDNANTAFWSQMHAAGIMPNQQFSLCFSRQPTADEDGTEAGAMTLGGTDTRLHSTEMVYTSNKKSNGGFFNVHVRKVYLREGGGGESSLSSNPDLKVVKLDVGEADLNQGNVIVDSGTTDTYFNRKIGQAFSKVYQSMTGQSYGHNPISLTAEQMDMLPTILIQFSGDESQNFNLHPDPMNVAGLAGAIDPENPYDVILALPPAHYMEFDDKARKYVARFYTEEGGGSVLGANAIMGHDVFFDIENNQIGFAESSCDYTKLVVENGFDASGLPPTDPPNPQKPKPAAGGGDSHDEDTPENDTKQSLHPAILACSDWGCRGTVFATLVIVCLAGVCCGRACSQPSNPYLKPSSELEIPSMDLEFATRYRDDPVTADVGVGYKDEPDDEDLKQIS
jgi:hypothetical protein